MSDKVITRLQKFLRVLVDESAYMPEPLKILEKACCYACGHLDTMPKPVTRTEKLIASVRDKSIVPPTPVTRLEKYIAAIAGYYTDDLPEPVTREDKILYDLACGEDVTLSGNPLVLENSIGKPLKECVISWEPVQEGAGEPSPNNIRPISGRDAVQVERCGGNLLDMSRVSESKGCTVDGGTIHVVDKSGWGSSYILFSRKYPAGTYTVQLDADAAKHGRFLLRGYDANGNMMDVSILDKMLGYETSYNTYYKSTLLYQYSQSSAHKVITFTTQGAAYFRVGVSGGLGETETETELKNFMLVPGSTPPTAYTPYRGDTYTLALPETVYGGTVDAMAGAGQETVKVITLDGGDLKFTNVGRDWNLPLYSSPGIDRIFATSHFAKKYLSINKNYDFIFISPDWTKDVLASTDELNAYLAAQYAAGTPVQIAYKLAEPVAFQAAGAAKEITTFKGTNTIMTDADEITATYKCNVKAAETAINNLYGQLLAEMEDLEHDSKTLQTSD